MTTPLQETVAKTTAQTKPEVAASQPVAAACCGPTQQTTCCEPAAKAACCDASHPRGCGCK